MFGETGRLNRDEPVRPLTHNSLCEQDELGCAERGACLCRAMISMFGEPSPQGVRRQIMNTGETLTPDELPKDTMITVHCGTLGLEVHLSDGRRTIVGLFFPGDHLDLSPLGRRVEGALVALSDSMIQVIDKPIFTHLQNTVTDLREYNRGQSSALFHRLLDHVNDLAKKTPVERIAAFIFELRNRQNRHPNSMLVPIPFGRRDIADYLGLQTETVSRAFSALSAEGAITLPETSVVKIENAMLLRQISNGGRPRKRND